MGGIFARPRSILTKRRRRSHQQLAILEGPEHHDVKNRGTTNKPQIAVYTQQFLRSQEPRDQLDISKRHWSIQLFNLIMSNAVKLLAPIFARACFVLTTGELKIESNSYFPFRKLIHFENMHSYSELIYTYIYTRA